MKHLNLWASRRDDSLMFSMESTFDGDADIERALMPFLQALEAHAVGWMPDVVKGRRGRSYSRSTVRKALGEEVGSAKTLGFYRTQMPALDMTLRLRFPPLPRKLKLSLYLQPLSFLAGTERCQQFVEMVRTWALHYPTSVASAHSMADDQLSGAPGFGRDDDIVDRDGGDKIHELRWLNVFGPKLVETVGRERMLSTPAHLVEELPGGSVLLVLRPTASEFASDEARVAQARAHVHLRPDLDFDTVLHMLRQRSGALAPVEPDFPPELTPLFSRLVDIAPIHERQRKIAEFNAFRPPEPEEWLPVALPSDVEHPERIRGDYGALSESLVAAVHTKVPSIMDETPESLTDLDFYFWQENFPERYERELVDGHTAPALGAYLGEVLVRRLGGTWVPRQNLDESQVRVGKRVWLPFLRARRYMQSRQALLDYSLTRFFKEAERRAD